MNIIEVNNLNKNYKDFKLTNISFNVPGGSIVGFVGKNGAGKTTTIKSILNLIEIDSGSILVFNEDHVKNEKNIDENIGVVLDNSFFSDVLNVKDINKIMKCFYRNWDETYYYKLVNEAGLPIDKKIKDFSSGMNMKLRIFSALAHHPKLLILDEPTSGLDPVARREIIDLFKDFVSDNEHAIFFSSHITTDLENIADRIIIINDGKLLLDLTLEELFDNYGVIKCSKEEFKKYDKADYVKYIDNRNNFELLVDNKKAFMKKYKLKELTCSIDDIMMIYIKGVK